jgi:hypothetical protein
MQYLEKRHTICVHIGGERQDTLATENLGRKPSDGTLNALALGEAGGERRRI